MKQRHGQGQGQRVGTVTGTTTAQKATPARTRTAETEQAPAPVPHEVSESPLYGVAMLKIAMELKKPNAGELEDILSGVLTRMKLSEDDFRAFLAKNGGLLRAIAHKRNY